MTVGLREKPKRNKNHPRIKWKWKYNIYIYFMCISVLPLCACVYTMCSALGSQKRALEFLELEIQIVVKCFVGARNWTLVLWKNSKCSYPLNNLSNFPKNDLKKNWYSLSFKLCLCVCVCVCAYICTSVLCVCVCVQKSLQPDIIFLGGCLVWDSFSV